MSKAGFFQRLRTARKVFRAAGTWRPQTINELDNWMDAQISGGPSASGANVTGETAVNFAAFYSGVSQICQTVASCATNLYRIERDDSFHHWKTHPLYRVLKMQTNPHMDAFRWKERMQYHAMVWGNGYSVKDYDGAGRVQRMWLLNPTRTWAEIEDDGTLVYRHRGNDNQEYRYNQGDIFHLAGFGFDGINGYSLIRIHRDIVGLGLSQQEFSGRFISNGTHLGGVLRHPKTLSDEAMQRLRTTWASRYSSAANAGKPAILEEGMEYESLGMPLDDAQFLESKIFQIQEIARILNISPYKLKDYSHATFSNIEHLGIEYATDTIRPWAERWEAAINTQLLNDQEQLSAFAEFDLAAIQRGDMKTMNEGYSQARNGGWLNGNEIRQRQGLNKIDGIAGEAYWMPKNMRDASEPEPDMAGRVR
jgi:HK97 family phage portal protein